MVNVEIGEQTFKMPNSIYEINSKIGFSLDKLIHEDYNDVRSLEANKWILSILCNTDYDTIDLVADEVVEMVVNKHAYFQNNRIYLAKYVILKHIIYQLREFDKDVEGNEMMIVLNYDEISELLLKPYDNYQKIFFKLYKPLNPLKQLNYKLRFFIKNYKNIDNIPYMILVSAIYNHLMWRGDLLKRYKLAMYDDRMEKGQQDEKVELTDIEKIFGLYHHIMTICNCDMKMFYWWLGQDVEMLFKQIYYLELLNSK